MKTTYRVTWTEAHKDANGEWGETTITKRGVEQSSLGQVIASAAAIGYQFTIVTEVTNEAGETKEVW